MSIFLNTCLANVQNQMAISMNQHKDEEDYIKEEEKEADQEKG